MPKFQNRRLLIAACSFVLVACATTTPPGRDELFITRSSAKPPAELHQAIRDYVQRKNWLYIGDNKLKGGEVTQVRICIREAAANIWSAGMHVSAMLPCGHMGIYQEAGVTKVTLLHPRFMSLLDPNTVVKKLVDDVSGPFLVMLDELAK